MLDEEVDLVKRDVVWRSREGKKCGLELSAMIVINKIQIARTSKHAINPQSCFVQ